MSNDDESDFLSGNNSVDMPPIASAEMSKFAENVSKKLASKLLIASLEKRGGDEAEAAALAVTIAACTVVMLWRVCNPGMKREEFEAFMRDDWEALSPMFEKLDKLPDETHWSKGGDA